METILQHVEGKVYQNALAISEYVPKEIRWFGDPILRRVTEPYAHEEIMHEDTFALIQKMVLVLRETNRYLGLGRGLAAPQIGVSRRVFVIFDVSTGRSQAYVNPRITAKSEEVGTYREMCISAIPLTGEVTRPWEIEFEHFDEKGKYHKVTADPLLSRVVQHEVDHLNGVLFVDLMNPQTISFDFDFQLYKSKAKLEKCLKKGVQFT